MGKIQLTGYKAPASERITPGKFKFRFSLTERRLMRYKKPIPVSVWAEKHRVLQGGSIPGRWQNLFTPYLVGIMDAAGTPGIETVIICKSPQTGGSEAGHNLVGWCIDHNPGAVMYVYPDQDTARDNARDRIIPMLRDSPRLKSYLTGKEDDLSANRINLLHMPIYLAWSGSVSRLGNKPIRTLILDELDKYQDSKNEATSQILAEKRTTTWRNRRHIFKISTPTTEDGPIWQAFTVEAGARFDYWVKCPHCGAMQLMDFERISWPGKGGEKDPAPEEVLAHKQAFYPCIECGVAWNDEDRNLAVRAGEWRERTSGLELHNHLRANKLVKVGFHIPAWLSYFVSLSEVASVFLEYKRSGTLNALKNLQNQYKAEPWQPDIVGRSDSEILALCDDRPRGMVPAAIAGKERVSCLLAGVDTQGQSDARGYFPYVIRAWGYGEAEESWLVQAGNARNLRELEQILWGTAYKTPEGREFPVKACMIDAMGARTSEIYRWALAHRGRVFPWQGKRSLEQPYTPSMQEYFPDARGRKIRIPGGMNLWKCDTTFFKSDLARKLAIAPGESGAFHLHSNFKGELQEYAREMSAEVWDDEEMAWVNPKNRANHFWDCEVMCLALAYILNVRFAKSQEDMKPKAKKPESKPREMRAASVADKLGKWRR